MEDKEIAIPGFLQELHGEKTSPLNLLLVYLAGIIIAVIVFHELRHSDLSIFKKIVVSVLFLDIASGVVANLSSSTNQYYRKKASIRVPFLFVHVLHPAILLLIFYDYYLYFLFAGAFTIISSFVVNFIKKAEIQQIVAATLLVAGIGISFFFNVKPVILYIFAPLFMVKLILGFSVRRPDFKSN